MSPKRHYIHLFECNLATKNQEDSWHFAGVQVVDTKQIQALSSAAPRPGVGSAGGNQGCAIARSVQEQARGQELMRFLAVALRALGIQSHLFFLECGAHFENGLAVLALIIVERHRRDLLLATRMVGEGGKIDAQQSADFAVDLAQEIDRLLLGLDKVHYDSIALRPLLK